MQSRQIDLTINKMTKAQYNAITPNADEIYLITDDNGLTQSDITTALGYTPVNPSSLATVATSGDYDDLTNKPTIPTVGDGTITITQGGVTKGTFTTNQSSNATIALDAGGTGGLANTATGTDSLTILGTASTADYSVNIGINSEINADEGVAIGCEASAYSGVAIGRGAEVDSGGGVAIGISAGVSNNGDIAIGNYAGVNGTSTIALGYQASATASNAIQIGNGDNSDANTLQIGNYTLLDTSTGLIPDARLSSNICTTNTAQSISGRKTFLGEKAIYFKQSATTNKLGFTLYNPSDTELGAFEWRPSTIGNGALLNINVPYSSSNYVGFRYWGTAVNIIAPKVATAGSYYIPVNITDGTNTVTANSNGTVDISSLLSSGGIQNTATGTDSLTILGTPSTGDSCINIGLNSQTSYDAAIAIGAEYDVDNGANASDYSVAIGTGAVASASYSVAIGAKSSATNVSGTGIAIGSNSLASGADSIALGTGAEATAREAYQIGEGTNNNANTLQVGSRQLLDITTGLIPDARLSSNIARTSQIPTVPTNISAFTNDSGYITSSALSGYATETWVGQQGYITSASLSGYLENTATGTDSLTVLGTASTYNNTINIGVGSSVSGIQSVAVGKNSVAGKLAVAIGSNAEAANGSIQLGYGTNSNTNTFSVGFYSGGNYELLDNSGIIPDARLSSNIARTSNVADNTLSNVSSIDSNSAVKTALDTKLNTADVWYDSTTSTLNIGVAQV